jgi:hypothetical protein
MEQKPAARTNSETKESRRRWRKPAAAVTAAIAATAFLSACSQEANSSGNHPASATATATGTGDPRAYQCATKPNPHLGEPIEECPIPGGTPIFRYTNLSGTTGYIPYSTTAATIVNCRIPQEKLPDQGKPFTSLHGGGEYILGGTYAGRWVAPADNFYNPSLPPRELSYDTRVALCSAAAIAAVTSPDTKLTRLNLAPAA